MTAHGMMFHHYHDNCHPVSQGSISAEQPDAMIDYLGRERILSADVWLEKAVNNALSDDDLCLTFDDALRC